MSVSLLDRVVNPSRRIPSAYDRRHGSRRGAHRDDPRLRDRRRPGRRRAVRHPARHLRRLHGVGPRRSTFIEDFIRDAVLPLYANTHTESSGTGLQTTRLREDARADHPRRRRRRRRARGRSSAARARPAAINKLVDVLDLRLPADLDDRYQLCGADPAGRAAGRVHRPVRAPLQRAAVARVDRRRRRDPRGPRRAHRPRRSSSAELAAPRRPPAEDRLASRRRVERHRHHLRHPGDRHPAAPPRRALVLGLRRRGAVRRDRHAPRRRPAGLQGRGLPLAAQVHRRPGHAGRARRAARPLPQPRARRCPAAARWRT